ncbi:hypothetical protein IP88_12905 [alpha proteobacterium AAP81b]|nr:hypothetical protein IP88_12905 [alpha proteobacterium AAP81b]
MSVKAWQHAIAPGVLTLALAAPAAAADRPGSSDHPLFPRYDGATITEYDVKAYDEAKLAQARIVGRPEDDKPGTFLRAEGKVSRIGYDIPKGRSVLEVWRNYQELLRTQGFRIVATCEQREGCGNGYWRLRRRGGGDLTDTRYALGRRADGTLAAVLVMKSSIYDVANVELTIVEPKAMENRITVVDAGAIGRDIAAWGRAIVYAIQFDTDKTVPTAASAPQLAEIARYMKTSRKPVLVVGHTDAAGDYAYNVKLSQGRAAAITAALASAHGVDRALLTPVGVGMAAPVASNATPAGQAKNRRVEIVAR